MQKFSQEIYGEVENLKQISRKFSTSLNPLFEDIQFKLLEERLSRKSVRMYFIRKVYDYFRKFSPTLEGPDFLYTHQIPFIWETIITIQYLQNHIYDGKQGITRAEDIRMNMIIADNLKSYLEVYIEDYAHTDSKGKRLLTTYMRKVFIYVNDGQIWESNFNTYTSDHKTRQTPVNFAHGQQNEDVIAYLSYFHSEIESIKSNLSPSWQGDVDIYFYRIFLTNTALFVFGVELVGNLLESETSKIEESCAFATGYGLVLQIVNDNIDFIYKDWVGHEKPTLLSSKFSEDSFSDLKNKILTLPLILHLGEIDNHNQKVKAFLDITEEQTLVRLINEESFQKEVLEELILSGAIDNSIKIGQKIAKRSLQFMDEEHPDTYLLRDMLAIGGWNSYYYSFNSLKKERVLNNFN